MNEQLASLIYYIKWLRSQGVTREEFCNQQDRAGFVVGLLAEAPVTTLYQARNWHGAGAPLPIVAIDIDANFNAAVDAAYAEHAEGVQEQSDGNLFGRYVLGECHTAEERDSLITDVESFWTRLNTYMTPQNPRAYGLAVGRVQSGKTRNYIGLMFKAIDAGYNTIIIVTSKSSQLAIQTHKRVEKWFGNDGLNVLNYRPLTRVSRGANGVEVGVEWIGGQFVPNQVQVGVVIKNESGHLENVREWMNQCGDPARRNMRLLFIDDESDSATPNTNNVGDPDINSPEDVQRLIQQVQISDAEGAGQIAQWLDRLASSNVAADAIEEMCGYLRRAISRANLMHLVREDARFKHLAGLDVEVEGAEQQRFDLFRLVHDLFNVRATRRRPLNWRVLRDFLNYVFGVRQERSRINRSICELVGQSADEPAVLTYEKMIYAGYTATPFANMLNEDPTRDPLCPDCIKSLSSNSRYFGLQRIFGGEADVCNMNIVRPVEGDEYTGWVQALQEDPESILVDNAETMHRFHNFAAEGEPEDVRDVEWVSLTRAVKWAFCTAAARRVVRLAGAHNADNAELKYRWTTMLFNLSHLSNQDEGVHPVQQRLLQRYVDYKLSSNQRDSFADECMAVWAEETARFTRRDFAAACEGYGDCQDYPASDSVREALRDWFLGRGGKVQVVQMNSAAGDRDQLDYNDPTCQDGDVLWFVCGGNAISRGLTLEGLTVSYYDRIKVSSSVDTITQMGRWFGYRPGYELLPRIWMTPETIREMKQICRIEESLHTELQDLFEVQEDDGSGGLRYPSIREGLNAASIRYFGRRLSGRDANGAEFAGATSKCVFETVREDGAENGFDITCRFCGELGTAFPVQWEDPDDRHARHRLFWRDVASVDIARYIAELKDAYFAGTSVFEAEGLLRELVDYPGIWNVVIGNPEGHQLAEVDNDFYNGYLRRNNSLRQEFGGVIQLGRKQFTGVALLSRVPNRYIEEAHALSPNIKIGDIRHVEEAYRLMLADPNCERWLANPTLLIDFVNGDAGQLFTQVSFYWYGHTQESFYRAVVSPARTNVIAPVVEYLNERGYASLVHLYHHFAEQFGGLGYEDLRYELDAACAQANPPLALVPADEADRAYLTHTVYYSSAWMANRLNFGDWSRGEVIGLDLYHRIIAGHWNWFARPFGGNDIQPIDHAPTNGHGYLSYALIDQAGYEKVMAYDEVRHVYNWLGFARHYIPIVNGLAKIGINGAV